jgi:glutaredoxin
MLIEVYSAPWCSNCDTLKKIFNEMNVDYVVVDIDTPEGAAKAQQHRVRGLPTTVIQTDDVKVIEVGCKSKAYWLDLLSGLM